MLFNKGGFVKVCSVQGAHSRVLLDRLFCATWERRKWEERIMMGQNKGWPHMGQTMKSIASTSREEIIPLFHAGVLCPIFLWYGTSQQKTMTDQGSADSHYVDGGLEHLVYRKLKKQACLTWRGGIRFLCSVIISTPRAVMCKVGYSQKYAQNK